MLSFEDNVRAILECNFAETKEEIVEMAVRQIMRLSIPTAQQWIPCSERLPNIKQSVILTTKGWTGEGCYWATTDYHVIWKGYRWSATYWDDEVIAWMPLPEPWKGSEK